ncbi:hypothetical protein JZ968_06695 [Riemerella anatipestifer]
MSVTLTTPTAAYFLTPQNNGKKNPISSLELTSLFKKTEPKYLGKVLKEDLYEDSLFAELMAMGNEFTFASNQIIWEEEESGFNPTIVSGTGVVSFNSGTFTINNAAIPADTSDINSERPTEAKWLQVKEGMEFVAFDATGKRANGKITSIAGDKRSFSATPIGGNWNGLAADNITVMFTGNNLDHCELAPCIGYESYAPAYENTMFKDSECVKYCEETEIANSPDGVDAQPLVEIRGEGYALDERLNNAQKILTLRSENAFAFSKRLSTSEANGKALGTNGAFIILEKRATKFIGMIETINDVKRLAANMRTKKIKMASLRVSTEQYNKLIDILDQTKYQYEPFKDNASALYSIGFAGFKIGEQIIRFKTWDVLDRYADVGKRYHWVLIPDGKVRVKFNKKLTTAGYMNIGWFGRPDDVWKYKRSEDDKDKDKGNFTVHYVNKFVPIILRPQDFMMGVTLN